MGCPPAELVQFPDGKSAGETTPASIEKDRIASPSAGGGFVVPVLADLLQNPTSRVYFETQLTPQRFDDALAISPTLNPDLAQSAVAARLPPHTMSYLEQSMFPSYYRYRRREFLHARNRVLRMWFRDPLTRLSLRATLIGANKDARQLTRRIWGYLVRENIINVGIVQRPADMANDFSSDPYSIEEKELMFSFGPPIIHSTTATTSSSAVAAGKQSARLCL